MWTLYIGDTRVHSNIQDYNKVELLSLLVTALYSFKRFCRLPVLPTLYMYTLMTFNMVQLKYLTVYGMASYGAQFPNSMSTEGKSTVLSYPTVLLKVLYHL